MKRNNLFLLGYATVYFLNALYMIYAQGFPFEQLLAVFVIFGLGFSLLGWVLTRGQKPVVDLKPRQAGELVAMVILIAYISLFLQFGVKGIFQFLPDFLTNSEIKKDLITLFGKLMFFVLVPYLVLRKAFDFTWRDFGLVTELKKICTVKNLLVVFVLGGLGITFNYFQNAAAPLRNNEFTIGQVLIAAPVLLIYLFVEVGLVEEFFFRGFLTGRLEALLKSSWGGVCVSALIFGLAHAPGIFFRQSGSVEGLGSSLTMAMSYTIAVQSVIAICLGSSTVKPETCGS